MFRVAMVLASGAAQKVPIVGLVQQQQCLFRSVFYACKMNFVIQGANHMFRNPLMGPPRAPHEERWPRKSDHCPADMCRFSIRSHPYLSRVLGKIDGEELVGRRAWRIGGFPWFHGPPTPAALYTIHAKWNEIGFKVREANRLMGLKVHQDIMQILGLHGPYVVASPLPSIVHEILEGSLKLTSHKPPWSHVMSSSGPPYFSMNFF